jgi:hypothetical protein
MHYFDDLQFKFELCREIQKRRKYMEYSKNLSKKITKFGNQALTNVPLAKKKLNPKINKKLLLCREPSGALGIGVPVPRVGRRHRGVLCRRPLATLGKRPVNRGNPWSTALPRVGSQLSAQVESVPTAQRQSRQHSGRQPKCDGTRSFSDGAFHVERWPSEKT